MPADEEEKIGIGDNILASGMSRGASKRGKKIAFGDGRKIMWDHHSRMIFQGNPNIAEPGQEKFNNIEWIGFFRGSRLYNTAGENRWIWNYEFKAQPGEIWFTPDEKKFADQFSGDFVVIEPNVPAFKSVAPNKQWPVDRYEAVAKTLMGRGLRVLQFAYSGAQARLHSATMVNTPSFRHGLAILSKASLYIGPEGGLHHGAAAVGARAVVLFGGFIPPQVTGYDTHTNLTGGYEACGSWSPCSHCREAMDAIPVDEVCEAAEQHLKVAA